MLDVLVHVALPNVPFSIHYPPVGRCIYCGSTIDLTREHVIPRGLKGSLILPEASCKPCAKITGQFEQTVLRPGLGMFRRKIGIKPAKKKDLVTEMPLRVRGTDGTDEVRVLPMGELPTAVAMPVFNLPDLLLSDPPPFSLQVWAWVKKPEPGQTKLHETGFTIGEIDLGSFMRMLAKIAHAYLVSQLPLGTFEPLLNDLIRHGRDDAHRWVGGLPMQPATRNLHTLAIGTAKVGETSYHYVDIRLFAQIGAPIYRVVVARAASSIR